MIVGRKLEFERIDALLAAVRDGRGGSLLIRGEPGIGKSTLLGYGRERAAGLAIVETVGVESESELAFAGLADVLRPLANVLGALPEAQADAVRSAVGIGPPRRLDQLRVGAATLAVLAAAAPLIVFVDDAHWLDEASQEALAFAARRLSSDAVAIIFAARIGEARRFDHSGLEELVLAGLGRRDARTLLAGRVSSSVVADRLVEQTAGNPLALLELPDSLTEAQLRGDEPVEQPLRVASAIERSFARRILPLGSDSRLALLTAAADDSGDATTVRTAVRALGIETSALTAAEDEGFVIVESGRLRFAHPLVRSAVYHGAAPSERRRVHAAIADVLAGRDNRRRAWHLAAAAEGEDADAAAAMREVGDDASARGAFAEAASAYERAARLAAPGASRGRSFADAAEAARLAGQRDHAALLVDEGLANAGSDQARGALLAAQAYLAVEGGRQAEALQAFLAGVDLVDRSRSFEILAGAVGAASQLDAAALETVLGRLNELGTPDDAGIRLLVELARASAGSHLGRQDTYRRFVAALAFAESGAFPLDSAVHLYWAGRAALAVGRSRAAQDYGQRSVEAARADGALGLLPDALRLVASAALDAGRWRESYAAGLEAAELASTVGQMSIVCPTLALLAEIDAAAGNEDSCRAHGRAAIELAIASELGFFRERAERALGQLELALGRPERAVEQLEDVLGRLRAAQNRELNVTPAWDLIEAYVRLGRTDDATRTLAEVEREIPALAPFEHGLFDRARGMVHDDFAAFFERALQEQTSTTHGDPFPFEVARTQLCYGERLRRVGERRAAREHLRAALDTFIELGAAAFADRATEELDASGQRRGDSTREHLTPRELQIALAVALGRSNKDVAASLFVTPKTVEFHLTRIYRKVGVRTRAELVRRFADR